MENSSKNNFKVGDTIPLGYAERFRLICIDEDAESSQWVIEEYKTFQFLWWEWSDWIVYPSGDPSPDQKEIYYLNHDEEKDVLRHNAESTLKLFGLRF